MRKYKFYCLIFIFQIVTIHFLDAQQENAFRLYNEKSSAIPVNKQFVENGVIPFSADRKVITGLSISGNVKFTSDFGLVRVILEDATGNEYLVYETYPLLTEGKDISFENICEETALLKSLLPNSLKIIVSDAECNLKSVETSDKSPDEPSFAGIRNKIRENQLEAKINAINRYNEKTQIGWYAGVNDMARLSFADKKRIFSAEDDFNTQGYEYYVSGFFTIKSKESKALQSSSLRAVSSSPYVENFDWRNRHGINWITPLRHQGFGKACWAFAAVAAAESYVNLYYNQKIDRDLSEQLIISCNGDGGSNASGGHCFFGTDYITNRGIVDEDCFPFADLDVKCSSSCTSPYEVIKINGSSFVTMFVSNPDFEDELKKTVITKGPLTGTIHVYAPDPEWDHAMEIVGYGKVKIGDVIRTPQGGYETINAGNLLIDKTYWIYKNSYGLSSGIQGYHYIVFENYKNMGSNINFRYFTGAVTSPNYTNANIICEDRDGDGYYFWGIGPKPATCPACAPNEPDGDDSNPNLGPMDEYGYCAAITPLVENITTSQTWSTNRTLCKNVAIQSGVTLTITATAFSSNYTITIKNGGKLILSGGTIDNGSVVAESGSELTLSNSGKILLGSYDNFDVQLGAVFNLISGEVSLK